LFCGEQKNCFQRPHQFVTECPSVAQNRAVVTSLPLGRTLPQEISSSFEALISKARTRFPKKSKHLAEKVGRSIAYACMSK
jgi:hypothetical protein